MKKSGHDAHLYKHQGKVWVEIDQCMLTTFDEIEQLVDRVHSFDELEGMSERGTQKNWAESSPRHRTCLIRLNERLPSPGND
jgi:hypothetical protein